MNTNKPSRLFLVILVLSLLEACSHKPSEIQAEIPVEIQAGIPVKLSSVQIATIEESSEFVAVLQSRCSVILQPPVEGRVTKIFVKSGVQVAGGTAIIELEPTLQQEKRQDLKIPAPCAGTVDDILVNEGEYVNTSTKLATITHNQPLEVNILVPVSLVQKFRLGIPVEVIDGTGSQSLGTSQVFSISSSVDRQTQSVLIKSLFDNSKGQLLSGQQVRVKVLWDKHRGILIPLTAVTRIEGKSFVFVVQSPGESQPGKSQIVAQQKSVKLGVIHQDNKYEVISGLQPGEKLIISNIDKLSNGAAIIPES